MQVGRQAGRRAGGRAGRQVCTSSDRRSHPGVQVAHAHINDSVLAVASNATP